MADVELDLAQVALLELADRPARRGHQRAADLLAYLVLQLATPPHR